MSTGIESAPEHLHDAILAMQAELTRDGKYRKKKFRKELPPWIVSINGARCAVLLNRWLDGLHHVPFGRTWEIDWSGEGVKVSGFGEIATYDFGLLTRLVLLAHEHSIRVEIKSHTFKSMMITLHPRPVLKAGETRNICTHHPTLADLRNMVDGRIERSE